LRRGRWLGLLCGLPLLLFLLWPERPPASTGDWLRAAGLVPRFETVAGVRIRYLHAGSGPPLLLLHGFGSSLFTWRDVLPGLIRTHEVVALDLPGFGESEQPPALSAALYPRVVGELQDRLGIPRASLVAHSMAGAIAVELAVQAPERVDRLVLLDAAGFHLRPEDQPPPVRWAASPALGAAVERLPIRRLLVRIALRQVFEDDHLVTAERVEEYAAPFFRPGAPAAVRSLLASAAEVTRDFPEIIGRVRAPTLIVWGRQDRWIPLADVGRFAAAIPGSKTVVLESCGHVPQEERPRETLEQIEAFLQP
jgi:pimeloyl-ACP methyl ester carboxylesterase